MGWVTVYIRGKSGFEEEVLDRLNGSDFPFKNGIILTTGGIDEGPGPNPGILTSSPNLEWPGDDDLTALIAEIGLTQPTYNATSLEFDFIPYIDHISFDFLFPQATGVILKMTEISFMERFM